MYMYVVRCMARFCKLRAAMAATGGTGGSTEYLSKVQLPWLELRPADTYEALCDSLIQLDEAVEEIFGRVERRVAEEQRALKGLEGRIERAGVLARRVAGSNAATCVLSAARYPAPDKLPDYRRLFYDEEVFAANAREVRRLEKFDPVTVPTPSSTPSPTPSPNPEPEPGPGAGAAAGRRAGGADRRAARGAARRVCHAGFEPKPI